MLPQSWQTISNNCFNFSFTLFFAVKTKRIINNEDITSWHHFVDPLDCLMYMLELTIFKYALKRSIEEIKNMFM